MVSPILLFEAYAADLPLCASRRDFGPPPSAYLHRHVTASGSAVSPVTVLGRASLCSLALIAAGFCEPPAHRVKGRGAPAQSHRTERDSLPSLRSSHLQAVLELGHPGPVGEHARAAFRSARSHHLRAFLNGLSRLYFRCAQRTR